jgi:Carboxypeptidase regulatory-like domain
LGLRLQAILALFIMFSQAAEKLSTVRGVLGDASGAVLPGADIALSGGPANIVIQTGSDGSFAFPNVAAGEYTVKVRYPGLEPFEKKVNVAAGRNIDLTIRLRPQTLAQNVTVTEDRGAELSLEPDKTAGGIAIKKTELDALPDNPDDLLNILQTLAGQGASGQILVDNFSGGQLPAKNTIQEIKINQDPFSAAYDWAGFGRIEIVTKPGGESLHGSAGLTDSDAAFNSRNPYAANKADYVYRMFTANVGDSFKTRGSYGFDFFHLTSNNTALINAVTLDSNLMPAPIRKTVVVPRTDISVTGRLDYRISPAHTLTGSYRYLRSQRDNNGIGQYSLESRAFPSRNRVNEIHLTETGTLNNNVVTDVRLGYTSVASYQFGNTSAPSIMVAGAFNSGSAQTGQASHISDLLEIQSNTTVVHGVHSIRFGGRLRYNPIEDVAPSNFGGTFSFFGVPSAPVLDAGNQPVGTATAPIGSLEQYRRTLLFGGLGYSAGLIRSLGGGASQFSIAFGNPVVRFNQTNLTFYGLDDWRARPNLTVSLGVRYVAQMNIDDRKDFGLRAAVAWSPGGQTSASPNTVVRAGWGAFYGGVDPPLIQQSLRFNGVTQQQYVEPNPDFYPVVPPAASLANGQPSTTYRLAPHIKVSPWMLSAISFERQLPGNTSVSAIYRDQRTTHIGQTVNINAPLPGTYVAGKSDGVRPLGAAAGNVFEFQSGGIQKAQWLSVQLNSKVRPGISISAQFYLMNAHNHGGYTDGGRWENAFASNPYDLNQDWGRAGWATKNNFNLIGTLSTPGGIQLSPLLAAYSGSPYDLIVGSDLNGDTVANDRPAFATDLTRPSVVRTKFGAFDTDPLPGQTIVPRNYLTGAHMWYLNMRVSKTFRFPAEDPAGTSGTTPQRRYGINFNVDFDNLFNHLNPGGLVTNLASPLFGQFTAVNLYRDTSNNRRIQFGTQFTF